MSTTISIYDLSNNSKGFRFYYDKDLEFILTEERQYLCEYLALRRAKERLRMYANLFNRDMRKLMITNDSRCSYCGVNEKLQIDHIIPVHHGGRNEVSNVQILCSKCNRNKSSKNNSHGKI
ncbi:MAG: HNH endonuclease [Soonwooa sp.]